MRVVLSAVLAWSLALAAGAAEPPDDIHTVNAWPLIHLTRNRTTGDYHTEMLWPFLEFQREGKVRQTALHPLFSSRVEEGGASDWHVLYPLMAHWSTGKWSVTQLLPLLYSTWRATPKGNVYHTMLFPFFYWGHGRSGSYFSFFPIVGTMRHFLARDYIFFLLFPLYAESWRGEVHTYNFLWPIVMSRSGGGQSAFRIFPLYSRRSREGKPTYYSILWPILHFSVGGGPKARSSFAFWPLFAWTTTKTGWNREIIPPFFRFSKDRAREMWQTETPWPLVKFGGTKTQSRARIFPLFSFFRDRARRGARGLRQSYLLWPLFRWKSLESKTLAESSHTLFLFYTFWKRTTPASRSPEREAWTRWLWPLFKASKDWTGTRRMAALSFLPFDWAGSFERDWGVFWELFKYRRSEEEGVSWRALWRLLRYDAGKGRRSFAVGPLFRWTRERDRGTRWSLLEGLFEIRSGTGQRPVRLFYFLTF